MSGLHEYTGMPGLKPGKKVKGPLVSRKVTPLLAALCDKPRHRAASCASDYGAITVWRDDLGFLHGAYMVRWSIRDHTGSITKRGLKLWLQKTLPRLEELS